MPWDLLFILVPFVIFFLIVRRIIRVVRTLQDPERLRALLSAPVREALRDAGLDPDRVTMKDLQGNPELMGIVASDVKAAVRGELLGSLLGTGARRRVEVAQMLPQSPSFDLERPRAIDDGRGIGLRAVLVLVAVALLAGAAFVLGVGR